MSDYWWLSELRVDDISMTVLEYSTSADDWGLRGPSQAKADLWPKTAQV